jgi:manganese transport protein
MDLKKVFSHSHRPRLMAIDFLKYIGPGFIVTIGFIDPGNWATNVAAGSQYGYALLWVVTLATVMLIIMQHNAAHLGIATGLCLSEAATAHLPPWVSRPVLGTAVIASISTALAEIIGGAIALNMLFHLPIKIGALLTVAAVAWMLFTNSYRKLEKWLIGFVSLIALSFIFELSLIHIPWKLAAGGCFKPSMAPGAMPIIMGLIGAIVMPHNLFLHSEIIQSRQINPHDERLTGRIMKYEFMDTFFSMVAGWAINVAMIILAAALFFSQKIQVSELGQAQRMLQPMLGNAAALVFALALLLSGISACVTAGMAGGSIFSGIFGESYDAQDWHTQAGILLTLIAALVIVFFISNPLKALIMSQIILSVQLPLTVVTQIFLTSSKKVMGVHANTTELNFLLWSVGGVIILFNVLLVKSMF